MDLLNGKSYAHTHIHTCAQICHMRVAINFAQIDWATFEHHITKPAIALTVHFINSMDILLIGTNRYEYMVGTCKRERKHAHTSHFDSK